MHCGGTQTRRRQERQGTPEGGCSAHPGSPGPQLPSPGLRSDPAQCNKSSPKVILTQALPRSSPEVIRAPRHQSHALVK